MARTPALALVAALALAAAGAARAAVGTTGGAEGPVYYVAAEVVTWDFAPPGLNACYNRAFNVTTNAGTPSTWTEQGLGRVYKKALYRGYTDDTFQTLAPKPAEEAHTGMLGPLMRAAVGQTLTVVLTNRLLFPVNLEPLGLPPADGPAGAPAPVPPGETATLRFRVPADAGPGPADPAARLFLYRSTTDLAAHGNAGLVGPLLVTAAPEDHAAARDIVTVLQIVNENASPLLAANLAGRTPEQLGLPAGEEGAAALEESNLKHTINGLLFCANRDINMTQGEPVRWHMAAVGSEADVHNLHLHGNTFLYNGHRVDQLNLFPGSTHSVAMSTENAGAWLMHCHIGDHIAAGMKAIYHVLPDPALPTQSGKGIGTGVLREYFVAADPVDWQYTPQGGDACRPPGPDGKPPKFTAEQAEHAGRTSGFKKAVYRGYTDATFTQLATPPEGSDDGLLGMLGPSLRAEVGDVVRVHFRNHLPAHAVSLHPHGVSYNKSNEGSPYADGSKADEHGDDAVAPGETYVYEWQVPESSGPGPADPATILWLYHSHVDEVADVYAGMAGAILVGARGSMREAPSDGKDNTAGTVALGTAKDVDHEVVLFFSVMNEAASLFAEANGLAEGSEEGKAYTINGFSYCNGPPMAFQQGDTVRLHVMALGTEIDIHSASVAGETVGALDERLATFSLFPGSMHTFDVRLTNPGRALVECRVASHAEAGMQALVEVAPRAAAAAAEAATADAAPGGERTYYVAAVEDDWDYGPLGYDACTGQDYGEEALVFLGASNTSIGSVYRKARYVEYTDASFRIAAPQPESHGILGPLIAADAGSRLTIVFRNQLAFPANLVPDGGLQLLSATDQDGKAVDAGAPVAPGGAETVTLRFFVPPGAGPTKGALPVVPYLYASSVAPEGHAAAGLVGALAVGAPGTFAGDSRTPPDVDALVPMLYTIFNENKSPLLGASLEAAGVSAPPAGDAAAAAAFEESNLLHSVNGRMFCQLGGLTFPRGARVRILALAVGDELDLHSVVMSGQPLGEASDGARGGLRTRSAPGSSLELLPAVARAVDVTLDDPGTITAFCSVHDHYVAGMRAAITVKDQ